MRRTRWSGTVLLAIFLWLFGATASFAQSDADDCYPIPDDGCVAADDGEVDDDGGDDDGQADDGDVVADDGETDDGDVAADDGDADDGEVLADDGEADDDDVEVLGVSLARTGSDLIGLLVVGAIVLVGGLTLVRRARGGNAAGG